MDQLVVALGEADFYNDAARLHCHAILNATICSQHSFAADHMSVDAKALDTLSLFYRVARPLYFDIDLGFELYLSQRTQGSSSFGHLVVQQASLDQFWRQLNFQTVSVHEANSTGKQPPYGVRFRLGLEHVDYNTQPSYQESGPALNANDINYPDCLKKATVTRVFLQLQVQAYKVGRSADNCSVAIRGNDATAGEIDKMLTADHTSLYGFLDAAIRCSISSARHRLAPGIRRAAPGFEHTLQTTFPTIFSPLGVQYLAERHQLISGVSKNILCCVGASRNAFSTLKHLHSASGGSLHNRQLSLGTDHGASFDRIESSLWECLATGARDAQGRIVLKPLLLSEPFADFRVAHLSNQDPVLHDRGSTESLFSHTLNSKPSAVDIADLLDPEDALEMRSALLHREDIRHYSLQPEYLEVPEKEWEDQTSFLPNHSALEGVVPETCSMAEALEVNEHAWSDQDVFRSNSVAGAAQKMLMDDGYKTQGGYLITTTQPGAEDESIVQIWDDTIGDAKSLSQTRTHIRSPNMASSNGDFARQSDIWDHPSQDEIGTADDIFSPAWSYMLDMFPPVGLPSSDKIFTPSTSFTDIDLFSPNSAQDTGSLIEDIYHQQIAKTPTTSPGLVELLREDDSENNMRWGRASIDPTATRVDVMNESDLSIQALGNHLRRNPPDKSVEDTVQQPSSAYTKVSLDQCPPNNKPWKRCSTSPSQSTTSQGRKPSLLRRLSRRSNTSSNHDMMDFDFFLIQDRDVDIKRRKTLEDYYADDEMLFD